jgi:diguanylate cyclase (GGDEF)-like protein
VAQGKQPPEDIHATLPDPSRTLPDMLAIRTPRTSRPPRTDELKSVLVVLAGPQVGERTIVERSVTVGRAPENKLVLRDPAVSWRHCVIEQRDGVVRLRDLGSKHGTEVNGTAITGEITLHNGDQLGVGDTILRFEIHDPVEQAFDHAVIERIARDDLTGLTSRRRFDTDLAALVEAAALAGSSLALLMIDIDGIKAINDAHGHLAGAQTIAEIGRLVGRVVAARGVAARLGGDELAVAMSSAGPEHARALATELLLAVRDHAIPFGEVTLRATVSIGIATMPEDTNDEAGLRRIADARLLAAKQSGRDRIGE